MKPVILLPFKAPGKSTVLLRQQGAALMVAMVMIFMMSILGLSAMRGATLEGQLANNTLIKELTFQAAESASDNLLAEDATLDSQVCVDTALVRNEAELSDASTGQATTTRLDYGGRSNPLNWSVNGPFTARVFIVTGSSTVADASTSTSISQGIQLIGANDPNSAC